MNDDALTDIEVGDLKTLILSSPPISREDLDRLVAYQRVVAAEAKADVSPAEVARIHRDALAQSGLDARRVSEITAVVADFAGKRWVLRRIRQKLACLLEADTKQRLELESARFADLKRLQLRHGAATIDLLMEREAELVDLHESLSRLTATPPCQTA